MNQSPYSGAKTRRNIIAFLIGKVPTALMTAAILGLSARLLDAHQFGLYVVAMATLEMALGLSTFGLDWILLKYAPVCRIQQSRSGLLRIVGGVAAVRAVSLALLAGALAALAGRIDALAGVLPAELLAPFALLLVVEGVMRVFRDNALEALALQSRLQLVVVAKNATILLVLLSFGAGAGAVSAADFLHAELAAAALSLLLAALAVALELWRMPSGQRWRSPPMAELARTAWFNYASGVVEYLYSPSFLIVLLSRAQPSAAIAGLGFVLRLVDIVRNYLPGMLVFGVVRSRMMGAYAHSEDYDELRNWAQFLFKISLLTLIPVLALTLVYGRQLLQLASGGRYAADHALFSLLIFWLAFRLHRQILGIVFNAVGLMRVWMQASLLSLAVLPLLYWFGSERLGVWFVALALFGNELLINGLAVWRMRQRGFAWSVWGGWLNRTLLALALSCAACWYLPAAGTPALVGGMLLLLLLYTAGCLGLGVFDRHDRQLINRSVGRTLFRQT